MKSASLHVNIRVACNLRTKVLTEIDAAADRQQSSPAIETETLR